ncbi:MAG: Xaa-Pro peptidase family protein [Candidatus Woesearchaeota archaeon]
MANYFRYMLGIVKYAFGSKKGVKSPEEIRLIENTQRATEKAMHNVVSILRDSTIGKDGLIYLQDKVLTSEYVKAEIHKELNLNYAVSVYEPIVSCGEETTTVHYEGSGPLRANETIVVDIFPKSRGYFADMSRTFVKGKASEEAFELYDSVYEMKERAIELIRPGMNFKDLTEMCREWFAKEGFKTGKEGFTHSLGHGVGREIHEAPMRKDKILENSVIAIEPGLYYKGVGGVRLEDIVVVGKDGCRNLTEFPDVFEL